VESDRQQNSKPPARRGLVPLIALLSMIGPFAIDAYLPSFPDIAADFEVGIGSMAQTISVYLIAFAGSTLLWGPLADALGRRRLLLGAMLFYALASLGCARSESLPVLLLFRLLQGIAASGGIVIARAVIRDVYDSPNARRVMAQVMMVFALAPAAAPIIGGWLHDWLGWRSVFHFLALQGFVNLLLVHRILPETHPLELRQPIHPAAVLRNYLGALRSGRFLAVVLTFCLCFGGLFVYIAGSPALIFDHLGLGATDFAVQFVPMVAGVVAGSWLAAHLSFRALPSRTVSGALALAATATVINLFQASWIPPRPVTVITPIVLYAFAVALSMPNLTVMALDHFPRNRGMAAAVQAFLQMTLNAAIAAIAVPLVARSLVLYALVQGGLLLSAILLWLFLARPAQQPTNTD